MLALALSYGSLRAFHAIYDSVPVDDRHIFVAVLTRHHDRKIIYLALLFGRAVDFLDILHDIMRENGRAVGRRPFDAATKHFRRRISGRFLEHQARKGHLDKFAGRVLALQIYEIIIGAFRMNDRKYIYLSVIILHDSRRLRCLCTWSVEAENTRAQNTYKGTNFIPLFIG